MLGDELHPVRVLRIERLGFGARDRQQAAALLDRCRIRIDEALVGHRLQNEVASRQRRVGAVDRVVRRRRLEHRREQGGVGGIEILGRRAEVVLGGALDAVRVVSEVDGVEIRGKDLVLRPALLKLPRERRLAHLALHRLRARQVRVLDELLRDGAGTLVRTGREAIEERAGDAVQVDAVVLIEALVLDRDDGILHHLRDAVTLDDHARLVGTENGDPAWCAGLPGYPD